MIIDDSMFRFYLSFIAVLDWGHTILTYTHRRIDNHENLSAKLHN